jgi:hypothetical protein
MLKCRLRRRAPAFLCRFARWRADAIAIIV